MNGQWLDCAGAQRFYPDPVDASGEEFMVWTCENEEKTFQKQEDAEYFAKEKMEAIVYSVLVYDDGVRVEHPIGHFVNMEV